MFRLTPQGEVKLTVEDTVYPNGLCFSPDKSILYVNDTRLGLIRAFDVNADGSVRNGHVFHTLTGTEAGVADGMKCDQEGTSTAPARAASMSWTRTARSSDGCVFPVMPRIWPGAMTTGARSM